RIARRPGNVRDYGALLPRQRVQQRALAGVGPADEYDLRLVRQPLETGALREKLLKLVVNRIDLRANLVGLDERDVLVGKVDSGFDQGKRFGDRFHHWMQSPSQFAGQELPRGA